MKQIKCAAWLLALSFVTAGAQTNSLPLPAIAARPFKPDWNSLTNYTTPDWFREAKFGIWAHWGPQCEPEHGDWFVRPMYMEDGDEVWVKSRKIYASHLAEYGHPSTNGFKDVIHVWKAEHFDSDRLLTFYEGKGEFDGQSDEQKKPFTAEGILFTQSNDGKTLYAIVLEIPADGTATITSLTGGSEYWPGKIGSVRLVGGGKLKFTRDQTGLHVVLPQKFDGKTAFALKIRA